MHVFSAITILIAIASLFSYINIKVLKMPEIIGLMIISLLVSSVVIIIHFVDDELFQSLKTQVASINFSHIVFNVMLSFLLFAGALHVDASLLKTERMPVAVFSLFGVVISTLIIGIALYYFLQIVNRPVDFLYCLLFGSIISPTDPIAVLGILTKANVPKRTEMKIVGESLFNDGVAVVVFLTILEMIHLGAANVKFTDVVLLFLREAAGGILFGYITGYLLYLLLKSIDHYQTEVMLTLAFVMAGYSLANYLHTSGPLAMVIAGVITGNRSKQKAMSQVTGVYMEKFWEMIDVLMNAVLFVLIGLHFIILKFDANYFYASLIIIPLILFARLVSIKIPVLIISKRILRTNRKTQLLLFWGGLRGGLSIALVLSLDESLPVKDFFVFVTYVVVVFSIFVQGLTVGPLAKKIYANRRLRVSE